MILKKEFNDNRNGNGRLINNLLLNDGGGRKYSPKRKVKLIHQNF